MTSAVVVCVYKQRVGMNGEVRVGFEATPDALPNRRWSDRPASLRLDATFKRDVARQYDVGEAYELAIGQPE